MSKGSYLVALTVAAVVFSVGWISAGWKKEKQIAQIETKHANYLRDLAEHNAAVISDLFEESSAKQLALDELDKKYYQELSREQKNNLQLITDLASAQRRLSVRIDSASCSSVPATTKATGMDDGAGTRAELHPTIAADIFRVAAQADECQTKLTALQRFYDLTTIED